MNEKERCLDNINECSKNTRNSFFIYLSILTFIIITLLGISDKDILLNKFIDLPVSNTNISLTGFFIGAPLISIIIYLYFIFFYLKTLSLIQSYSRKYGNPDNDLLYPWLLDIKTHRESNLISGIEEFIKGFFFRWFIPLNLILMALIYLKSHSSLIFAVLIFSLIGIVICDWTNYHIRLKNELLTDKKVKYSSSSKKARISYYAILGMIEIIFFFVLIPRAMSGERFEKFQWLNNFMFINLGSEVLINKEISAFRMRYYADLSSLSLQGARLEGSLIHNADLRKTRFTNSSLNYSDLSRADLRGSDLHNTTFLFSILKRTDFDSGSIIKNTDFNEAKLQSAGFSHVQIYNSTFIGTDISKAVFKNTKVIESDMSNAHCDTTTFESTAFWSTIFTTVHFKATKFSSTSFSAPKSFAAGRKTSDFLKCTFDSLKFENVHFDKIFFQKDTFSVVKFNKISIDSSMFVKSEFTNGLLEGTLCKNSNILFCEFKNMCFNSDTLYNVNFRGTVFDSVRISDSIFRSCPFRKVTIKNSGFYSCNFDSVDFSGAIIVDSNFQNTHLTADQLMKAKSISNTSFDQKIEKELAARGIDFRH